MPVTNSVYVAAAMSGNFWQESGVNPGIYEGLRVVPLTDNNAYGGFGIGQWTNAPNLGLTRRTQLVNWLRANGWADDSGPGQLSYLVYENTWYQNGWGARFTSLSDFFASTSNNLEMLTYAWMQGWEGIWDGTQGIRYNAAQQCLAYIQTHYNEDPGDWIAANRFLSEAERLHNALLLYNWLTDNEPPDPEPPDPDPPGPGPGPDPPAERRKGMPIWMMVRRWN